MKKFTHCSICRRKIGFLRKIWTNQLDKDPVHLIPLSQFCSDKCADIGLTSLLKKLEKDNKKK